MSLRAIPRSVFHPVPNVDSVLVGLRRRSPARLAGVARARRRVLRASAQDARRVARLSGRLGAGLSREHVREALLGLGQPADARAERLSPEDFRALAAALGL